MSSDACWYAVQVAARQELPIAFQLRSKEFEEFVPVYSRRRKRAGRVKQVTQALFPGYVFCRLNLNERLLPLFTTPGVIRIVGAGRTPIPIADDEIASLRRAVASPTGVEPYMGEAVGDRVLLTDGPLAGCQGVILDTTESCLLIVSITLLRRSLSVEIDRGWAHVIRENRSQGCRSAGSPG